MTDEIYSQMAQAVIDGEDDTAAALAQKGLDMGLPAADILDKGFVKGIEEVGELFGKGEFFLPELVQGAEAMKAAVTGPAARPGRLQGGPQGDRHRRRRHGRRRHPRDRQDDRLQHALSGRL